MKTLLHLFTIIFYLLTGFPSMANETSLQRLLSQAEEALADNDRKTVGRLTKEIYELMTGFDPSQGKPEHISIEDYRNRVCLFLKATDSLMTVQDIENLHHEMRPVALMFVLANDDHHPYVQAITECIQDNGTPVPGAIALKEGIEWALKLEAADIVEKQVMAREYEELFERHPENQVYQQLNLIIRLSVDKTVAKARANESKQRLEALTYRRSLAEKANKGDVSAQLEVALRLETGDKFEQNSMFAYYWYKRAEQNGGGEEAQKGLVRLLPRFNEIDLMRIENMIEKKHLMY